MVKKLRFSKINLVEQVGALMLVTFLDDDGNMYQWAPKWKEVEQVFLKQINIERFNKPEGEWLNKFAKTAQNVVEGAQRIESGRKLTGGFVQYEKGLLRLRLGREKFKLTPGFDVTIKFLDNWLDCEIEAFVINDIVIRVKKEITGEYGRQRFEYYPPKKATS